MGRKTQLDTLYQKNNKTIPLEAMKLRFDTNKGEPVIPVLKADGLNMPDQQMLLELARTAAAKGSNALSNILPAKLRPWTLSIILHFLPAEEPLALIVRTIDSLEAPMTYTEADPDSAIDTQFAALTQVLNHRNVKVAFNEHSKIGFIKASLRFAASYRRPEDLKLVVEGLNLDGEELAEVWNWFDLELVPAFYFQCPIMQWEKIAHVNKLYEFIEVTFERCKVTVGDGVFLNLLKSMPVPDLLKFNENQFTNLHPNEFELLGNIYTIIITKHPERLEFVKRYSDIVLQHQHDDRSLQLSISVLKGLKMHSDYVRKLEELIKSASLLRIYDLAVLDQIKDSEELQQSTLVQSTKSDTLTRTQLKDLISLQSVFFNKLSQDKFHEAIINSLLIQGKFILISEIPDIQNHQETLVSKFWFYYKHEFNNCYKILDYIPEIYTKFLSSYSSLQGIKPLELLDSSSQQILERLFQLNSGQYRHYYKYHNILNTISELIPSLRVSDFKIREVAIEYGIIDSDFEFILTECFKLFEDAVDETDKNERWLLVYKVIKIVTINYASGEIESNELIQKNLELSLKLLKIVPASNIHDVIENFMKLKDMIS